MADSLCCWCFSLAAVSASAKRWIVSAVLKRTLPVPEARAPSDPAIGLDSDEASAPEVIFAEVLTPDDLMTGRRPSGKAVTLFDDDHYYMGGVLAELLVKEGHAVTLVTPAAVASAFTKASLEQKAIQARLLKHGVKIVANQAVVGIDEGRVTLECTYTGEATEFPAGSVVLVPKPALEADHDIGQEIADNAVLAVEPDEVRRKISVKVGKRDTMASIVQRYNVSAADVREWNDLKNDKLRPGQQPMPPRGWKWRCAGGCAARFDKHV